MPEKRQARAKDEVAEYLIRAGVDEGKARKRPEDVPMMRLRRESPFQWDGADYRPDLFRYSMVFSARQERQLERAGFFALDASQVDVRMRGVSDGRVMARPMDLEKRATAARAEIDYRRRTAKNVRTSEVLDAKTGAAYEMVSNSTPATATEVN